MLQEVPIYYLSVTNACATVLGDSAQAWVVALSRSAVLVFSAIALCEYNKPRTECGRLAQIGPVLLPRMATRPDWSCVAAKNGDSPRLILCCCQGGRVALPPFNSLPVIDHEPFVVR